MYRVSNILYYFEHTSIGQGTCLTPASKLQYIPILGYNITGTKRIYQVSMIMDVNQVLVKYVGSFGRYQKWKCFLLGMLGFVISFYSYEIVFTAAIPDHWCTLPQLNTNQSSNLTIEKQKEFYLPKEERNGELVYSSCLMYDDTVIINGSDNLRKTKKCSKWTYDQSVFRSTIVSEVFVGYFKLSYILLLQ